jgi:hypothetical protein
LFFRRQCTGTQFFPGFGVAGVCGRIVNSLHCYYSPSSAVVAVRRYWQNGERDHSLGQTGCVGVPTPWARRPCHEIPASGCVSRDNGQTQGGLGENAVLPSPKAVPYHFGDVNEMVNKR